MNEFIHVVNFVNNYIYKHSVNIIPAAELLHGLKLEMFLTQSQSRPGAATRAETPELCDASPADRRCPPS